MKKIRSPDLRSPQVGISAVRNSPALVVEPDLDDT